MSKGRVFAIMGAVVVALVAGGAIVYTIMRPAASTAVASPAPTTAPTSYTPIFSSSAPQVSTFDVKGALTLFVPKGSTDLKNGQICQGTEVYADAKLGTLVQVYDTSGKALTSGVLGQGEFVENKLGTACTFSFTVRDVPDGAPKYGVEVGSHGVHEVSSVEAHSWVSITDASL